MRLLSIAVRNYRIHRDLTVELDPFRTVIAGPNESGKSTLAEAAHRALFLKAKTGGETQKTMVSHLWPGHPEVEVRFETAGAIYRIAKRFSGGSGTATLTREGGQTWKQDEAESELAELLRVEDLGKGKGAARTSARQWTHLWVRQGESGADPSPHADSQRDSLLARLQESGGAAVMESELDSRVASRFNEAFETLFTKAGKPKAHSEPDLANQSLRKAKEELENARQTWRQLEQAAGDFLAAGRIVTEKNSELESLSRSKRETEEKLEKAGALRHRAELEERDARQAALALDNFMRTDREIADLGRKKRQLKELLEPGEAETKRLETQATSWKDKHRSLIEESRRQGEETKATRSRLQLVLSWKERFDCQSRLERIAAVADEVADLKKEIHSLDSRLAALPQVTAAALKSLQALSRANREAAIALQAVAAGIAVRASSLPVTVAGEPLAAGESRILTEDTEVRVGDAACLLVSPGGGARLADLRQRAEENRASLETACKELGVKSEEDAIQVRERRLEIENLRNTRHAEWKAKGADDIDDRLADATHALESAAAEVVRRQEAVGVGFTEPSNLEAANGMAASLRSALDAMEATEMGIQARIESAEEELQKAERALAAHRQGLEKTAGELKVVEIRLATHEESHGDAAARKEKGEALAQARREAERKLEETREALKNLQADTLEADLERFNRALDRAHDAIGEAEKRRAVAGNLLTRDGATDPAEALALAGAEVELARHRQIEVERKAEAVRLLSELFAERRRSLADRFTRPLAETIAGYLQQIFGPEARAEIALSEGNFEKPVLNRGGRAFSFDELSGGAREQLAAAFRLAMAEILAQDHDGCLPLVFDDAFAHSDPDRTRTLQRMLDLAARRGLQVILLTCHPAAYADLGARTVSLSGVEN